MTIIRRIHGSRAIAELYFALVLVFISARLSIASFPFTSSSSSFAEADERSLQNRDVCVGLTTECLIQGYAPGQTIKCEEFRSQPPLDSTNCQRFAVLVGNATNIFNTSIAMSIQVDGGSARTVFKNVGEKELIGPAKKVVNLCNINSSTKEYSIFDVEISSGYRLGQNPLVRCEDTRKVITLVLPTRSPTTMPSTTTKPSSAPSTVSSSTPSEDTQRRVPTKSPVITPSTKPSTVATLTPSSTPSEDTQRRVPTKSPVIISTKPSTAVTLTPSSTPSPTTKQCKVVGSKGKGKGSNTVVGSKGKGKGKGSNTRSPNRALQSIDERPLKVAKGKTKAPNRSAKGKGKDKTKAPGLTKAPNGSVKAKGKGSKKSKGKGGKGKKRPCRTIATNCADLSEVSIQVPMDSEQITLHYGVEIFTENRISKNMNETILVDVGNFFTAGLVGCDAQVLESLNDAAIASVDFQTLEIADERTMFEGLQGLCMESFNKFEGSVCNKASGSIEIFLYSERRRLEETKEDELFDTLEEILNLYADSISEESNVVVGLHYDKLSREAYGMSTLPDGGTSSGHDYRGLISLIFVGLVLTILLSTMFVIKNNERRHRQAREPRYDGNGGSEDLNLFEPDVTAQASNKHFPVRPIEDIIVTNAICLESSAYDFSEIDIPLAPIEEEEVIQRRQLLREYTIPTIVRDLHDQEEDDVCSVAAELCGDDSSVLR
eukprot:CAMPEP_0203685634 /NCGR_PEP_ID=MMETSP0090-20130426/48647_1 /ASSEMBLY_ACC=CAM_ASM_001088 /TAXON_ID=426623 /ORGANISM="Chaetoceros affinis, Strain CCMP159" /LENGTH=715 /DNA_ID=CAMNT_0050554837 /DNA_START=2331 /DNA_END=4478 /DNA_ORIENTATION=+